MIELIRANLMGFVYDTLIYYIGEFEECIQRDQSYYLLPPSPKNMHFGFGTGFNIKLVK